MASLQASFPPPPVVEAQPGSPQAAGITPWTFPPLRLHSGSSSTLHFAALAVRATGLPQTSSQLMKFVMRPQQISIPQGKYDFCPTLTHCSFCWFLTPNDAVFVLNSLSLYTSCVHVSHFSPVRLFAALWTAGHQAPLSVGGFSRQGYWSGLPYPPPGDLLDLEMELVSPALQADSLLLSPWGSPPYILLRS